jgi:hypothetical protein
LFDIAEAIDALERFCSQVSFDEFLGDELRQSAVLQKFIVIGEAAARLPDDFKRRHPDIDGKMSSVFEILPFMNTLPYCGRSYGIRQFKTSLSYGRK